MSVKRGRQRDREAGKKTSQDKHWPLTQKRRKENARIAFPNGSIWKNQLGHDQAQVEEEEWEENGHIELSDII